MKRNKYIIFILPIFIIIFMMTILIGYSAWIISESTAISTHEETTLIDENMNNIDDSFVYNGQSQLPHKSNDTPSEVDDYIYNYCDIIKYYDSNGDSIGSGYNCNTIIDAGEYTATYYSSQTHIITTVNFKIEKAKPIIPEYYQICYYDKNASFDISKIIPLGVDGNPIDGEWVHVGGNAQTVSNEVGEQDKHYSTFTYYFDSNDPNYCDSENIDFVLNYYSIAYFYSTSTTTYYCNLSTALSNAESGTNVYIIPNLLENDNSNTLHEIIIDNTITVKSGVTLYIPYEERKTHITKDEIEKLSTSPCDTSSSNVKKYRKTLLKLTNSAQLIIDGTLYLGGQFSAGGISGNYTEINLDENSSIVVNGTMYAYGYIKENSFNGKNATQDNYYKMFDNTYDSNRYISINSGGNLYTPFSSLDLAGMSGSALGTAINNNICPINIFEFPSVQTYLIINQGANLYTTANMYVADGALQETVHTVGGVKSNAIFKISSGQINFHYNSFNLEFYDNRSFTTILVDGKLSQGYLKLTVMSMYTISTETNFLPISYKLNIKISENSTYESSYKIKLMPGSYLEIAPGANVVLNNSLIAYKSSSFDSVDYIKYPSGLDDAKFVNNGTLTVSSSGELGAFVETFNDDGKAQIIFEEGASTNCVSEEGRATLSKINIFSEGYFYIPNNEKEICQFVPNSTLTSSAEYENCWDGNKYRLNSLDIIIDLSNGYTYNILGYQIFVSEDSNGTNEVELTSGITSSIDNINFSISDGMYIRIVTTRCSSVYFNNSEYIYQNNTRYLMNQDLELVIVPSEGIQITFKSTSISGAGNTEYTFFESSSSNGSWQELKTYIAEGTIYIIKNYYFKIEAKMGTGGSLENMELYTLELESIKDKTTNETYKLKTAYQATKNIDLFFTLVKPDSCITADTLITLADGSKKMVKDLLPTDLLLVFNHITGQFEAAPMIFNDTEPEGNYRIINLKFSDGTIVKVVYEHGFFDLTLNEYVYIREDNAKGFIGHKFYQAEYDGTSYISKEVELVDVYITEEITKVYSPVTVQHLNYFTEGMLSMPAGIEGLFNIFEYGDNLTYDADQMQKDIKTYGLYTYEDFKDYVPYEVYEMFPAQYFKVAVGKGMLTFEDIVDMIYYYLGKNDLI